MGKKESKNNAVISILVAVLVVILTAAVGDSYSRINRLEDKTDTKVSREELKTVLEEMNSKIDIVIKLIDNGQKNTLPKESKAITYGRGECSGGGNKGNFGSPRPKRVYREKR